MQAQSLAAVLTSILFVFLIIGLICGWCRGYAKSLLRLGIVLAVAVLTFFVVPSITKAILSINISNYNIVIGNVAPTTIEELIIASLEQIPYISDLIAASPSFEALILVVPQAIVNVAGFIVFFYLFKLVSLIIYWIFAAIVFPKKKNKAEPTPNKHRFIGAMIGAVQGFIVAIVMLLPIYGSINAATPIIKDSELSSANVQIVQNYAYAEGETPAGNEDSVQTDDEKLKVAYATAGEYVDAINNAPLTKVFNFLGVGKLADVTFEKLTTVQKGETTFNLKKEVTILTKSYKEVKFLMNEKLDLTNPEHARKLESAINNALVSKNVSSIVSEMMVSAAEEWTNPEDPTFIGIKKPDFQDADLNEALDKVLIQLKDPKGDVKKDITAIMRTYVILAESGVLSSGDVILTLKEEKNADLVKNTLDAAIESPTLKVCLPSVINCAIKVVYRQLDFTEEDINGIGALNQITEVDWKDKEVVVDGVRTIIPGETTRIQNIVTGAVNLIYDARNVVGNITYENVNFGTIGYILDNLRKSTIFGTPSLKIVQTLLKSEKFVGDPTKFAKLSTSLANIWGDKEANLEQTFLAFNDAMKLADKMDKITKDENVRIEENDVKEILKNLNENKDTMKDVIDEVVNDQFLKDLGVDEKNSGVIKDVVNGIFDEKFDAKKEAAAAAEIINTATKINKAGDGKTTLNENEANDLVKALEKSDVLTKMVKDNVSNSSFDFNTKLDDAAKANISKALEGVENPEKKAQLLEIFGGAAI